MTPVFQTQLLPPEGNCLQAAVASVLDLPLDAVPHFVAEELSGRGNFYELLRAWLADEHGLSLIAFPAPTIARPWVIPPVYHLLSGRTSLGFGAEDHVAVAFAGKIVHDPHPRRTPGHQLHDPVVWLFLAVDPSRRRHGVPAPPLV